ncbi:MAG: hypothetical protein CMJ31_12585 [Phycisphaerae bacterium]|nr:hypothetical protein [Phycisphaerae bacterium]
MSGAPLWHGAIAFACRAHLGQTRRDGRTPYAAHVVRVAFSLRDEFGVEDEEILAAAALHDVIEDTPADYDDVAEAFGDRAARLVATMTKDMRLPEAEREVLYERGVIDAGRDAWLIKLGDVLDNLRDAASLDDPARGGRLRGRAERLVAAIENAGFSDEAVEKGVELVRAAIEALH